MAVQQYELEIYPSLGFNSALNPAQLPQGSQRVALDACMKAVNTIGKRPGSVPVTTVPLDDITYLTTYLFPNLVTVGAAPTLAAVTDVEATLPTGTYYVRYTFETDDGETNASAEASQTITLGQKLVVTLPALKYHANKINVYISATTNAEQLEGSTVTTSFTQSLPLVGTVDYPIVNTTQFSDELLAVSGDTLYSFYNGALNPVTMTDTFDTPKVFSVAFKDDALVSALLLVDGGSLKYYNGSVVQDVTPAANAGGSVPNNILAAVNALGIKYIWIHKGYIFLSAGTDLIWYMTKYEFDYLPETQYFRYVRNNDYITGPGMTFANLCVIPMRRGWGVLLGSDFGDGLTADPFTGNDYLNTLNGNISSRGFSKITYPDGRQTIAYLSDDGVHEIFDTGLTDTGVRQYSTRALMKDKVNFAAYNFTEAEKESAVATFDIDKSWFELSIPQGSNHYVFKYDTRNESWYGPWRFPWAIGAFERFRNTDYYAGSTGLLHAFQDDLYSDWDQIGMTTGTPIDFDVYSGLLSFEFSGDDSYLHYYLLEAQQFDVVGSIDVYIIYGAGTTYIPSALLTQIFIYMVTSWEQGQWANIDYTDFLNGSKRMIIHRKAKYFQRRWRNPRDEPTLILRERFLGTVSGR